ncbi:DUF4199 domain-containing protein [Flavobacterium supellecticarium]|uniref:DUF4199 domain-containing protein n=1 Tax=Flavobacterium supellecticarium TaxID=2565924 RepID=A0A4S4A0Y5_9FLAO|nr:DUF4199 domain-containing protein [Flavobacterium supellecticarium]THF51867.1 DUF4199 domain-containing protein [Flavobacterium supellecticarium]
MKKFFTEIKWSIIFSVATVLWLFLEKIAGFHDEKISSYFYISLLFGIVYIIVFTWALKEKKATFYNGTITYKQAFISGAILTLLIAAISPLVQTFFHEVISPDFFDNAIANVIKTKPGNKEFATGYFNLQSFISQGFLNILSLGIILSAIAAYFIQTKNRN